MAATQVAVRPDLLWDADIRANQSGKILALFGCTQMIRHQIETLNSTEP